MDIFEIEPNIYKHLSVLCIVSTKYGEAFWNLNPTFYLILICCYFVRLQKSLLERSRSGSQKKYFGYIFLICNK